MVHFSPLDGSIGFENKQIVLERAKQDLETLQRGGVDAVMFENNFDTPKFESLPESNAKQFEELIAELAPLTHVPWGIAALWNDYRLGFRLCKQYGGMMVRVPVFVDDVETTYGIFYAKPDEVLAARKELDAQDVALLVDVHVKHAKMLTPRSFKASLRDALNYHPQAVVITGQWTGDPPSVEQCKEAQQICRGTCGVLTGSGMTAENISQFIPFLDGCIVGTAFKEGDIEMSSRSGPNIVEPARRYDVKKIEAFMKALR